jgi:hypothetical protein
MHIALAILNPWVVFAHLGRLGPALGCLALQLTLIGWLPAAAWAYMAIRRAELMPQPRRLQPFNIVPKRCMPPRFQT